MLKKLLSLFGIGKEEENKSSSYEKVQTVNSTINEDIDDEDDDEDYDSDEEDDDDEWPEEELGQRVSVELDPVTLHGLNYTEAEFDAEVEKRVQQLIKEEKEEGEDLKKEDIDNLYFNIRRDVYQEWTGANLNMVAQWEQANSMKFSGYSAFGNTVHNENNPLLEPIHGVSLQDYAAISYYVASGSDFNAMIEQLGIDYAIYQEANTLWAKRMQEDESFTVTNLFSQYYNSADQHPKLKAVAVELSPKGKETIEKMMSDRFFYEELCGARIAAYEYGLDGSQWIMDNYEVSLGEFQKVATYHMEQDNKHILMEDQKKYGDYQDKMTEEYKKKFATEQGGNVADDINF